MFMCHLPRRQLILLLLSVLMVLGMISGLFYYWHCRNLDLIIVGGLVVDGTGTAPRHADVAVRAGRIVGISSWLYRWVPAQTRLSVHGRVVAPGFIDVHTHVEPNLPTRNSFQPANFLKQGVTTIITGNCGRSRTDVAAMLSALERNGSYINVATLVGHNSIRRQVMEQAARAPSAEELRRMKNLTARALYEGALGFSTGLAYAPGRFATFDELVALAKTAADHGGIYVSHVRNEASDGEEAILEALNVGKQSGATVQISHIKCSGRRQWDSMGRRLNLLAEARATGLRVYADAYPYERSSTTTDILLPDWAVADKRVGVKQAAINQLARQKLKRDIFSKLEADGWHSLAHVKLAAGRNEWIGKTLAEIPVPAATLEQQIENLIEVSLRGGAQAVYSDMNEADVAEAVSDEFCVFGSDSAVRDPSGDYRPHPRGSGTFPRIFARYVRENGRLSLAQAVRKASGLAAEIFGLKERGHLVSGEWADVVIFNLYTIEDRADYDQPFAEPLGIDYVIVNGVVVVAHGSFTEHPPSGRALRSISSKPLALAKRQAQVNPN